MQNLLYCILIYCSSIYCTNPDTKYLISIDIYKYQNDTTLVYEETIIDYIKE